MEDGTIISSYSNRNKKCLFDYKKRGRKCVSDELRNECSYHRSDIKRMGIWRYLNWLPNMRKAKCKGTHPVYTIVVDLGESWNPDYQWKHSGTRGIGYRKIWWAIGTFLKGKPAWTEVTVYTRDDNNRYVKFVATKWQDRDTFILQCMNDSCGGIGFKSYVYVQRWGNGQGRGRKAKIQAVADSREWGNTCQGLSNKHKVTAGRSYGTANLAAQKWWIHNNCNTKPQIEKKCPPQKECPKQYNLGGYKDKAMNNLKEKIDQSKSIFNALYDKYEAKSRHRSTQKDLMSKQNNMIDLRNNMIVKSNNELEIKKDDIHTTKRRLLYEAKYNRRNVIITRILKAILLILAITVIVILAKNAQKSTSGFSLGNLSLPFM